jgi:hypothetical protein
MGFLADLFRRPPYPSDRKHEVEKLIEELVRIGKVDDFLSERPGGPFNMDRRHVRTREIGKRLNEIGGVPLMEFVKGRIKKTLGANLADHLAYAWSEIGAWVP